MPTPFDALERRAANQRNQAQASARPARVRFFADVEGYGEGEVRFSGDNMLSFATYMLEEPLFTYGFRVLSNVRAGELPIASASVLRYEINDREFYTGADIGIRVRSHAERISLRFSLIFDGYALRSTARVSDIGL